MDAEADAPLVTDIACSPADSTFACATSDHAHRKASLALWNMRAFKKAHTFALPPSCAVTSVAFSPDGHQLAAAGVARRDAAWCCIKDIAASSCGHTHSWAYCFVASPATALET